jgi:hypothetical protein
MSKMYFDFDEIINIESKLKEIIGNVIMSSDNELFQFKSYNTGSTEIDISYLFQKKKVERVFIIQEIVFVNNTGTFKHTIDDQSDWCTSNGVNQLIENRDRYLSLKGKLVAMASVIGEPIVHFPVMEDMNSI